MTQEDKPSGLPEDQPPALDYCGPAKNEPITDPAARWFGYIGVGLMMAAILVGVAAMIWLSTFFLGQ